jgi:hypothetical protein
MRAAKAQVMTRRPITTHTSDEGGSAMKGTVALLLVLVAGLAPALFSPHSGDAEQPPPPCHPNPSAAADRAAVARRGDIINLPQPLKDRLIQLADRPHSYLPIQAFAEADGASRLFQY